MCIASCYLYVQRTQENDQEEMEGVKGNEWKTCLHFCPRPNTRPQSQDQRQKNGTKRYTKRNPSRRREPEENQDSEEDSSE